MLIGALTRFYGAVDRRVRRLQAAHAARLRCRRGCSGCCVDGLTVFEVEARYIRHHCGRLLAAEVPHPAGACALLDAEGACRIYTYRPYVCRTQGLPLRWIDQLPDGSPVEMRDICPVNEAGPPVERLPAKSCWTIGPFEQTLSRLQTADGSRRLLRVPLRTLMQGRP
jgi:hypothetical protein